MQVLTFLVFTILYVNAAGGFGCLIIELDITRQGNAYFAAFAANGS